MYDVIIIGGGPGGVSAGIYAARKQLKSMIIAETIGGQSSVSADVQNWIGTKSIDGYGFAKMLGEHLRAYEKMIEIHEGERVTEVSEISDGGFLVKSAKGEYQTKTIIVCSGSRRKKLDVPGEKDFEGKGAMYCSICDAPMFPDKDVAVVGGGNAGLEAVIDLNPYAKKIYLLVRKNELKGDQVTQEKIKKFEKLTIIYNAVTTSIIGEKFVRAIRYKDTASGEEKELPVDGVFIQIGALPNTEFLGNLVQKNPIGEIILNHKTGATSKEGIYAAGDATDEVYKQNNISAGDSIKALLSAYAWLHKQEK